MERKATPLGQSYWNQQGAYQVEKSEFYDKLVPDSGEANTVHGELIRSINRLYYDFCNNGNCNAVKEVFQTCRNCHGNGTVESSGYRRRIDEEEDFLEEDCQYCDGEGQDSRGFEMGEYFGRMFEFIQKTLPKEDQSAVKKLEEFILSGQDSRQTNYFGEVNMAIYDAVMDAVMYYVLTTENSPREVKE